jgi:twitching motility two-component system response regulator PilG
MESPQSPRILCVDNSLELLSALKIALKAYGFEPIVASNATEALARFHAHGGRFYCVLTDHTLPGGTGVHLAEQLRLAGYQGRIIVMSADLGPAELAPYKKLAICGFFRKPFGLPALITMLRLSPPVAGNDANTGHGKK